MAELRRLEAGQIPSLCNHADLREDRIRNRSKSVVAGSSRIWAALLSTLLAGAHECQVRRTCSWLGRSDPCIRGTDLSTTSQTSKAPCNCRTCTGPPPRSKCCTERSLSSSDGRTPPSNFGGTGTTCKRFCRNLQRLLGTSRAHCRHPRPEA